MNAARIGRRVTTAVVLVAATAGLVRVNAPLVAEADALLTGYKTSQADFKAKYGQWQELDVPAEFRVNAVHAALLHTGKVLIVAGSGNNRRDFDRGSFKSILFDPSTDKFKLITTPTDLFCSGHAFLQDGKLLVAGGTQRYEALAGDVTRAAGAMQIKNESPHGGSFTLPKGTEFTSPAGKVYRSTDAVIIRQATKTLHGPRAIVTASETDVWVEAVEEGKDAVSTTPGQFRIGGLRAASDAQVYGFAERLTFDKQEFQGTDTSYEFNPWTERYERVADMKRKRWYPTLTTLADGNVVSVSGLDGTGRILPGQNELYLADQKKWIERPELKRKFATYPSLFLMGDKRLFYSGSSAGYGSHREGRQPGLWDVAANSYAPVPGLPDADMAETSASLLLPPAQDQRVMLLGGGGIGDSERSTRRTAIADLSTTTPRYRRGPDLAEPTRYLSTVILPDDKVLATGGSSGYRGAGDSDHHIAQLFDPVTNSFAEAADPSVGRNYHSEALLLPDGRVMTLGGDPLYDKTDTKPGTFEQRIEIYSPPYLHQGPRPRVTAGPGELRRGAEATFTTPEAARIAKARLVRPSAVTHATDVEQRSVALGVERKSGAVEVKVPRAEGLVPSGWYMLYLTDDQGVPSVARWVRVP